jgi:acyl carrier protein
MTQTEVTKEEIMAVYPKVAETMADALGCDVEDVKLDVSLIEGLDAESIDFLDMVFRLERTFKIKIPRGKIVLRPSSSKKASSPKRAWRSSDRIFRRFPPSASRRP